MVNNHFPVRTALQPTAYSDTLKNLMKAGGFPNSVITALPRKGNPGRPPVIRANVAETPMSLGFSLRRNDKVDVTSPCKPAMLDPSR